MVIVSVHGDGVAGIGVFGKKTQRGRLSYQRVLPWKN